MMGSRVRVTQAAPAPLSAPVLAQRILVLLRPVSHPNSSIKQFRKRVPADIQRLAKGKRVVFKLPSGDPSRPDLTVAAKIGGEVTFSLRTSDPSLMNRRQAAAIDQLEVHFQTLREGVRSMSRSIRNL
jgi:hypothetical protein